MSTASVSPWANKTAVATKSLAEIMSEELVANETATTELDYVYNEEDFMTPEELAAKYESIVQNNEEEYVFNEDDFMTDEEKADRDFALALAAQEEEGLCESKKDIRNGNSKVNVCSSLDQHYLYGDSDGVAGLHVQASSDNVAAEELSAKLVAGNGNGGVFFKNGVTTTSDGTRVSKHDGLINGMMNSISLGELECSGDMSGLLVGNTVTNHLKTFSQKQKQKGVYVGGGRVSAKDSRSTSEAVMDENTRLLLFKLIQKSVFDEVHGVIKTGKESNVYHAARRADKDHNDNEYISRICLVDDDSVDHGDDSDGGRAQCQKKNELIDDEASEVSATSSTTRYVFENSERDCNDFAVKVFKTTLNEFSNRVSYIKGDHRFSRERYAKNSNNKRKFIAQWVEKEFRNLCRARAKGLNVPRPVLFKDNVLVMEMIVDEYKQERRDTGARVVETGSVRFINSPQLKEVESLSCEQWEKCYLQTLQLVFDLYQKCKLVHADLSEYNLLLRNSEDVFVLDFGQAIDTSHPTHKEYLSRDLKTINSFFVKKGVDVIQDIASVVEAIVRGDALSTLVSSLTEGKTEEGVDGISKS